jgi:hypothetical protein
MGLLCWRSDPLIDAETAVENGRRRFLAIRARPAFSRETREQLVASSAPWLNSRDAAAMSEQGSRRGAGHRSSELETTGGAPRKIRTSDNRFRRPVLYPAELWAQDVGDASLMNRPTSARSCRIRLLRKVLRV